MVDWRSARIIRFLVSAGCGFAVALVVWLFWPDSSLLLAVVPLVVGLAIQFFLSKPESLDKQANLGTIATLNQCQPALLAEGVGAWLWDLRTRELHCTENVFRILGRGVAQTVLDANVFEDSVHKDDREAFQLAVQCAKEGTRRSPLDCRFVKPGGGVVWVELSMRLVDGESSCIAGAMTDVTERKHVEAQLDKGAAFLEAILENTENIVFSIDTEFRLTVFNSKFLANIRLAYGKTLHLGDHLLEESPLDIADKWRPRYERALAGESFRIEEVFDIDGKRLYFDVSLKPIRERGRVTGAAVYSRNITKQKAREKDWLRAKERAEESDRLKSAFLANMSHEIRTPLNAVMGFAQLLKSCGGTEVEREKFVDIILSNGNHLLRILGDIIELAQIESNQLRVDLVSFDLKLTLTETYSIFNDRIRADADGLIELVVDTDVREPDYILCDETRLKQIIYNLVSNSVKFTLQGSIHIGYERKGDGMVEFFVADTGSGIPAGMKERVFKRFRQGAEQVGRRNDGVGLGLSICQGLVALLGGEIWVEDNIPHGSVFRFTVRDYSNGKCNDSGPFQQKEIKGRSEASPRLTAGSLILVAEDDDMNFQVIEQFLVSEKLVALRAVNGKEAIVEVERNESIRLVVMDLSMPVLNGLEATKRIKELRPDLPVVAHTAHAMKRELDLAMEAGCSDCLVKPISIERFKLLLSQYV